MGHGGEGDQFALLWRTVEAYPQMAGGETARGPQIECTALLD